MLTSRALYEVDGGNDEDWVELLKLLSSLVIVANSDADTVCVELLSNFRGLQQVLESLGGFTVISTCEQVQKCQVMLDFNN